MLTLSLEDQWDELLIQVVLLSLSSEGLVDKVSITSICTAPLKSSLTHQKHLLLAKMTT